MVGAEEPHMEILVVAALIGLIPAAIANNKGYSFVLWWFFGAALFIVALPVALLMTPNAAAIEQSKLRAGMKKCPFCAELVKAEAKVCKHCGRDLLHFVSEPSKTPDKMGFDADRFATLPNSDTPASDPNSDSAGRQRADIDRFLEGERLPPKYDEWGHPLEQSKAESVGFGTLLKSE